MNLTVPGHTVHDALVAGDRTANGQSLTDLVLGLPGLLAEALRAARSNGPKPWPLPPSCCGWERTTCSAACSPRLLSSLPRAAFCSRLLCRHHAPCLDRRRRRGRRRPRCHACALSHARPAGGGAGRAAAGPNRTRARPQRRRCHYPAGRRARPGRARESRPGEAAGERRPDGRRRRRRFAPPSMRITTRSSPSTPSSSTRLSWTCMRS